MCGEISREIRNEFKIIAWTVVKSFPRSILFTLFTLPFILFRKFLYYVLVSLSIENSLLYLRGSSVLKLPLFLPDGRLVIWEVRDLRYLQVIVEVYVNHYYDPIQPYTPSRDWIIVDAGAHVGFFTLYSSNLARGGVIIALEPVPENFNRLIRHIRLNSKKQKAQIIAVPFALGGKNSEVPIMLTEDSATHHLTGSSRFVRNGRITRCKTITLPSLANSLGIPHVDLLKIDIEGSEYEVLYEAETSKYVRKSVRRIVGELHGSSRQRLALIRHLRSLGYIIDLEEDIKGSTNLLARICLDESREG